MGAGKNVPVHRQSFSITSAAKIRRTAVVKRVFLQCRRVEDMLYWTDINSAGIYRQSFRENARIHPYENERFRVVFTKTHVYEFQHR